MPCCQLKGSAFLVELHFLLMEAALEVVPWKILLQVLDVGGIERAPHHVHRLYDRPLRQHAHRWIRRRSPAQPRRESLFHTGRRLDLVDSRSPPRASGRSPPCASGHGGTAGPGPNLTRRPPDRLHTRGELVGMSPLRSRWRRLSPLARGRAR